MSHLSFTKMLLFLQRLYEIIFCNAFSVSFLFLITFIHSTLPFNTHTQTQTYSELNYIYAYLYIISLLYNFYKIKSCIYKSNSHTYIFMYIYEFVYEKQVLALMFTLGWTFPLNTCVWRMKLCSRHFFPIIYSKSMGNVMLVKILLREQFRKPL